MLKSSKIIKASLMMSFFVLIALCSLRYTARSADWMAQRNAFPPEFCRTCVDCVIIMDERPTGIIQEKRPMITTRLKSTIGVEIDLSTIQMVLDGHIVPHTVFGSGPEARIRYAPDHDLKEGEHAVIVEGSDVNGVMAEKTWTFIMSILAGR